MAKIISILFILSFALLTGSLSSASNFDDFNTYIQERNLTKAKAILENWGANRDNDPQYYICLFNYHLNKSRTEGIGIQKTPPRDEKTIQITDPKTGKVVGYFAPSTHYDADEAQKGINHLKVGLNKFPDHYEMRFGLLYMYKELHQFDNYLSELENGLKYFKTNNLKKVYWNNNKIINNPSEFIIETAQGNFYDLMSNDAVRGNTNFLHKHCDILIKYFPKHKYGYSDKGVIYYRNKDFKNALANYVKASTIDPQDELIASNIGFLYKKMGDKNNAKKYFKKAIQTGKNNEYIDGAKQELKLLENR